MSLRAAQCPMMQDENGADAYPISSVSNLIKQDIRSCAYLSGCPGFRPPFRFAPPSLNLTSLG